MDKRYTNIDSTSCVSWIGPVVAYLLTTGPTPETFIQQWASTFIVVIFWESPATEQVICLSPSTFHGAHLKCDTLQLRILPCKAKRQYLLTLQVNIILAFYTSQRGQVSRKDIHVSSSFQVAFTCLRLFNSQWTIPPSKAKRQYLLTCKVSRYCLLALHGRLCE